MVDIHTGLATLGGGPLGFLVGAPFAGELVEAAFVNEARTRYRFPGDPQDLELNGLLATMAFSYCWALLDGLYPNAAEDEPPAFDPGARLSDLQPNGGMLRCPYQLGAEAGLSEADDIFQLWLPAGSAALPSEGAPHFAGVLVFPGQQVAGTVLVAAVKCHVWVLTESNSGRDLDRLAAGAFANVDDWAGPVLESGFQEEVPAWRSPVWLVVRRGDAGEGPTGVCRLELGSAEPGEVGLPPEPESAFLRTRTAVYPPDIFWEGVSSTLVLHLLSREWYPAPGKKLGAALHLPTWGSALGVTQKGVDVAVLEAVGDIVGQPEWIYKGVACTVVSLPPVSSESELVEQVLSLAPLKPQAEEEPSYFVARHKDGPRIAFIACAPGASSNWGQRGVRVLCSAALGGAEELSVAAVWVSLEGTKTISEGPIAAHRRAMAAVLAKRTVDYRPPVEGIDVVAPERLGDPQPWKLGQPAPHHASATQMGKAGSSMRPDLGTTSLRVFAGPGLVANTDGHASVSDTALSGVQKVVGHAPAATKLRIPTLAKRLKDLS